MQPSKRPFGYTIPEITSILGINKPTIDYHRYSEKFPKGIQVGTRTYYSVADVQTIRRYFNLPEPKQPETTKQLNEHDE